ncbi:MAG TPA: DmsC/YnfH family molybdoenzyme membrane anchor subunit [Polyangiaceae bacterium]|nr:DmsC/YnfH family molybdoenzyme membrane anchor subunit [Polyangiaceae bacterium]
MEATTVLLEPAEPKPSRVRLPLVSQFLELQQDLTAVERFSRRHEADELPAGERVYKDLIPLAKPAGGQQYAFQVDLDACTGCKACVTACHRLNGLDDDEAETWRSVGLLHGGTSNEPVQQTVTTACHHCVDPACMKGCPVNAYEKDPITGIVKHLDDQCIGCQYCTLTCPYEVPQFSKKRGIVRKCDMCSDRLDEGEAPACVQACPNEAISIRIVETQQLLEQAQSEGLLPGTPSSGITVPSTQYKTNKVMPKNLLPGDFYAVRAGHQHMPLVIMLVLTQLSAGAFWVDFALHQQGFSSGLGAVRTYHSLVALALGLVALGASTMHLGRPHLAFRAIIGIRTSWLSREVLGFGLFANLAMAYAALQFHGPILGLLGLSPLAPATFEKAATLLGAAVSGVGAIAVACSVMLYKVTQREWWGGGRTSFKFFLTAGVLGTATTSLSYAAAGLWLGAAGSLESNIRLLSWLLMALTAFKLLGETTVLLHLFDRKLGDLKRTALLLRGQLVKEFAARLGLGALGGLLLPVLLTSAQAQLSNAGQLVFLLLSAGLLLLGELLERMLFFKALSAPKMPGAVP